MEYNALCHHGIKGQKWGVRRFQNKNGSLTTAGKKDTMIYNKNGKMRKNDTDSAVTRKVKNDYNTLNDNDFRQKYGTSRSTYAKRVEKSKSGDPYADNPIVKRGLKKSAKLINRENKKIQALEKDIRSFDPIKDGLVDKKGRVILTKEDVNKSVKALINEQNKHRNKIKSYKKSISATSAVNYNNETNKYEVSLKRKRKLDNN